MLESFGARLRQRREELGIDLLAIAEQTKIKRSLLEALERDDVSQWPGGIYRRAYIRTYAQAIGLDPGLAAREFLQAHPEPLDVAAIEEIASLADGARSIGGPPTRLRSIMGSALGSFSWRRRSSATDNPLTSVDVQYTQAGVDDGFETPGDSVAEGTPAGEVAGSADPADAAPAPEPQLAGPAPAAESMRAAGPEQPEPDFLAVAQLCTRIGQAGTAGELQTHLREAAGILDAKGLIVWIWDAAAGGLRPALVHGYSHKLLAQLPPVGRDADNATAAAFRSAETCVIEGSERARGAVVVPLLTADGCAGVLAIELGDGREQSSSVRAAALILGAQLAQLAGGRRPAEVRHEEPPAAPPPAVWTGRERRLRARA